MEVLQGVQDNAGKDAMQIFFFFFLKILLGKILEGPAGEANHRKINKDTLSLPNS